MDTVVTFTFVMYDFISDNFGSNVFWKNYRIDTAIETLPDSKVQVSYHEIC
jgi:hypothetical protein